jgi:hypothetical protein
MKIKTVVVLAVGIAMGFLAERHLHAQENVVAVARDMDGSTLVLTDRVMDSPGPCVGKMMAVGLPPGGNFEAAVPGCWIKSVGGSEVTVTYLLRDGVAWTDTFPVAAFRYTKGS